MLATAKLILIFVFMLLFIKKRISIAHSIFLGALGILIAFGYPLRNWPTILPVLWENRTLQILFAVILIALLGNIMKQIGKMNLLTDSLHHLFRDERFALAAIPAFIGLLPMVGGAMLSAPMIGELGNRHDLNPEKKTAINFWFRHIWEFVMPLYPGFLLAATIFGISTRQLAQLGAPMTLLAAGLGILFFILPSKRSKPDSTHPKRILIHHFFQASWPIWLVIVLFFLIRIPLPIAVFLSIVITLIAHKFSWKESLRICREGFSWNLAWLVLAVMLFSKAVDITGAAEAVGENIPSFIPMAVILFFVPFIIGLITGITHAFVGIAFPILAIFLHNAQGPIFANMILAYAGGFVGILLSPVHLCLALTKDYFGAEIGKLYQYLIPPTLVLTALAFGYHFVLGWL